MTIDEVQKQLLGFLGSLLCLIDGYLYYYFFVIKELTLRLRIKH